MTSTNNPLLSICIPTYNRANLLKKTLDCIVTQRVFIETDHVEVVISNNNSTDNTEEVALDFQSRFPNKIVYIRTKETTSASVNFANALLHAQGELCKLHNDSVSIQPEFLESVISLMQKSSDKKYPIFFLNGNWHSHDETTLCESISDFVSHVSFYMTWIGGFSILKEDIQKYVQHFIESNHQFPHTEILLKLLEHGRSILVYNAKFGEEYPEVTKPITTKILEEVYIGEYIPMLRKYVDDAMLRHSTYGREVTKTIIFYMAYYYRLTQKFQLTYINDFYFLKKYVPLYKYYLILILYPLYIFIHPYRKNVKLRKFFIYLSNMRRKRSS